MKKVTIDLLLQVVFTIGAISVIVGFIQDTAYSVLLILLFTVVGVIGTLKLIYDETEENDDE